MAANKKSKTKSKKAQQKAVINGAAIKGEDLIHISPARVRFQHSKIRPHFSGCGRSVTDTLEEIREGRLDPGALPPIQVLIGPDENDGLGPWYFSLNNRRLWVLKQCHKEGLLDNERYNNKIAVRVRPPKSDAEAERYSVENCALEAKFMREAPPGNSACVASSKKSTKKTKKGHNNKGGKHKKGAAKSDQESEDSIGLNNLHIGDEDGDKSTKISNGGDQIKSSENGPEEKGDGHDVLRVEESDSESESDDDGSYQNPFSALL